MQGRCLAANIRLTQHISTLLFIVNRYDVRIAPSSFCHRHNTQEVSMEAKSFLQRCYQSRVVPTLKLQPVVVLAGVIIKVASSYTPQTNMARG